MSDMTQAQEDAYFERHDAPENCGRLSVEQLSRYCPSQAELVERLATNWEPGPYRDQKMLEHIAKRLTIALHHSGLKLSLK